MSNNIMVTAKPKKKPKTRREYNVNFEDKMIILYADFRKRLSQNEFEAVKKMKALRELYPDFAFIDFKHPEKKANKTDYAHMEKHLEQVGDAMLLEQYREMRESIKNKETKVLENGWIVPAHTFFSVRSWFTDVCGKKALKIELPDAITQNAPKKPA